jgi:hypothetical protein
VEVNR